MRTKFAAMIGMIVILATSVLPARAAGTPADAPQYAGAATSIGAQQYTGARQPERALGRAEQDAFRNLAGGWHYRGGSWYYIRNGKAVRGWIRDGGKWYFLGGDGRMQTGWIRDDGKWYYLAGNGAMRTGWIRVGGKWYYLAGNGAMRTGWIRIGKKRYYLAASGAMQTGWVKDGTRWYYLAGNGTMKTGWLKIGEKAFYLTKSGARATGWRTIGDRKYYFRSNGVLDARKTKKAETSASPAGKNTTDNKGSASFGSGPKTKGDLVAEYALKFVGNPYVYGGCSLTKGTDCSGFVMLIYRHFGVSLPHYDAAIRTRGKSVSSLKEARAGDIICYYGHVAIYLGDGRIVHASNSRDGIKISERADYREIASIRRIFD